MKDERGVYYYPNPNLKTTRMYVRKNAGGVIEFRLWSSDNPEIWDRHQWLSLDVIREALKLRTSSGGDSAPSQLYDERVAEGLLLEAGE